MTLEERGLIKLGRREGIAGTSKVWEVRVRGRIHTVDRNGLRKGLNTGWLTGIESVRRVDGDWGPLFGRPVYREIFQGTHEPRDHAKARAAARAARLTTRSWAALCVAGVLFAVSFAPGATELALLGTLLAGLGSGLARLLSAVQQRELDDLVEQLVPPVLAPPAPVDWARAAAEDEVEASLKEEADVPPLATTGETASE